MSVTAWDQEALDATGAVLDLIDRHGGRTATPVTARVRHTCSMLASGDEDALKSLLTETSGGMGSLNDYGFGSGVDAAVRLRKDELTAIAAEKCRIALRARGIEPWR